MAAYADACQRLLPTSTAPLRDNVPQLSAQRHVRSRQDPPPAEGDVRVQCAASLESIPRPTASSRKQCLGSYLGVSYRESLGAQSKRSTTSLTAAHRYRFSLSPKNEWNTIHVCRRATTAMTRTPNSNGHDFPINGIRHAR